MSKDIDIDIDALNSSIDAMESAINSFKPYANTFTKNTSDKLGTMKSDFIEQFKKVMDNMTQTKAPSLVKKLDGYKKTTKKVKQEFEQLDKDIANSMK